MKMHTLMRLMLLALLVVGCGDDGAPKAPSAGSRDNGDGTAALTERMTPAAAYYEVAMSWQLDRVFGRTPESTSDVQTIYINTSGGTFKKGFSLGESFLLCADSVTIPERKFSENDMDDLVYYVTKYIESEYPNTKITFDKPTEPNSTMVVITESAKTLGCASSAIKFTAPLDKGNLHPADIGFVFASQTANLDDLVTQVQSAIETMIGAGDEAPLGLAEGVSGEKEINSLSRLLWELEENKILNIDALKPDLDKLIPGGARYIDDLNKIVTVTVGVGQVQPTATTPPTSGPTARGGLFSWIASIFSGGIVGPPAGSTVPPSTPSGLLSAIGILTGHPEIAMIAKLLGSRVTPNTGTITVPTGIDNQALIPDYSALIGLGRLTNVPDLIAMMESHASYVGKNYDDQTKQALDAMLVVAYSQAFRGLVK